MLDMVVPALQIPFMVVGLVYKLSKCSSAMNTLYVSPLSKYILLGSDVAQRSEVSSGACLLDFEFLDSLVMKITPQFKLELIPQFLKSSGFTPQFKSELNSLF